MATLEFWFDFSSPFTYLGSTQVARVAREHDAALVYRPFLLGALFQEIGTPMVPMAEYPEARRAYMARDLRDWAAHWGVPLQWPSRFPLRTLKPLRMVLAAPAEQHPALVDRLMTLCWVEDGDPDDDATLAKAAVDAGLDAALVERMQDPAVKAALKDNTDAAAERGFPGAPVFAVGDHWWWGQDRLLFVEHALAAAR